MTRFTSARVPLHPGAQTSARIAELGAIPGRDA